MRTHSALLFLPRQPVSRLSHFRLPVPVCMHCGGGRRCISQFCNYSNLAPPNVASDNLAPKSA